jgi:hypothetical protein
MEDFVSIDEIKALFKEASYINLSTIREDGRPHPSNVRVVHGHGLSLYFLSETTSAKSTHIADDPRVGGSMLIGKPKPGTGFNLYFDGLAQVLSKDNLPASLIPVSYDERQKAITALCAGRDDYASNIDDILSEKGDLKLHRIILTQAWFNGGIYKEGSDVESNATRNLAIVSDKECPLVRRYLVEGDKPIPDYAMELPEAAIRTQLRLG